MYPITAGMRCFWTISGVSACGTASLATAAETDCGSTAGMDSCWITGFLEIRVQAISGEEPNASVTLTGNRIEWNAAGGIVAAGGSHYNITGNYIDRSGQAGIELRRMHTVSCTGNVLYRSGKFQENDPEGAQCILEECAGLTFTGNSIKHGRDDNDTGVITPAWAMRLRGLTDWRGGQQYPA